MSAVCPHCGFDMRLDTPMIINEFSMFGAGSDLYWLGKPVKLTGSEATMMFSLMKVYPNSMSLDVLLERMGSDGGHDTIAVFATRVRNKLRALGAPIPFRAVSGNGKRCYQWLH